MTEAESKTDMTRAKLQHRVTRLERDLYAACEAVDRLKCENARLQRERRPEFTFRDGLVLGVVVGMLLSAAVLLIAAMRGLP